MENIGTNKNIEANAINDEALENVIGGDKATGLERRTCPVCGYETSTYKSPDGKVYCINGHVISRV